MTDPAGRKLSPGRVILGMWPRWPGARLSWKAMGATILALLVEVTSRKLNR